MDLLLLLGFVAFIALLILRGRSKRRSKALKYTRSKNRIRSLPDKWVKSAKRNRSPGPDPTSGQKVHLGSDLNFVRGKAYVIDGDSIRCRGLEIRLADLDAPEFDQIAYNHEGKILRQGALVRSALIKKIGGKLIEVWIDKSDYYGRKVGTVYCDGENINLWLIRRGFAVAAFSNKYAKAEIWAKEKKLGMWGMKTHINPKEWRRLQTIKKLRLQCGMIKP